MTQAGTMWHRDIPPACPAVTVRQGRGGAGWIFRKSLPRVEATK